MRYIRKNDKAYIIGHFEICGGNAINNNKRYYINCINNNSNYFAYFGWNSNKYSNKWWRYIW